MPVKLTFGLESGWKEEDNKRFGAALVIRFIDTKTDKVLFRYAPKLADKDTWDKFFKLLGDYDGIVTFIRDQADVESKGAVC